MPHLFKISGSDLDNPAFSARFASGIAAAAKAGQAPIVVHGGGKELTELLTTFKIETRFVDGLRVTFGPARDAALMVLSGLTNKRLTAAIIAAGADAIGLSGIDGGLVRVEAMNPALGFVGKPVQARSELLANLVAQGFVPVINPMSLGFDGEIYNVNADHVAGALAVAMDADMLTFVTNVPGVLDGQMQLIPTLTATQTNALIASGVISGGMIPKVKTALEALAAGVKQVRITNLDGLAGGGTVFG
ncbi:MAG: acetylglutamate kinase [Chloroflexota bacterium]|jgi:acetylglutamate kinase|nr:acetylglutamate kinase [Chloroflexota bacterium]